MTDRQAQFMAFAREHGQWPRLRVADIGVSISCRRMGWIAWSMYVERFPGQIGGWRVTRAGLEALVEWERQQGEALPLFAKGK